MSAAAPALASDLVEALRRLKLSTVRRLAPEVLLTAKTQRWAPEELLRTLVEAEIAARDASNAANRMKAAAFPVAKTLDEFDLSASSIPKTTFDYLASLEWIRSGENLCLVGPAGTGKSHLLELEDHLATFVPSRCPYVFSNSKRLAACPCEGRRARAALPRPPAHMQHSRCRHWCQHPGTHGANGSLLHARGSHLSACD